MALLAAPKLLGCCLVLVFLGSFCVQPSAAKSVAPVVFSLPKLRYAYNAIEPFIDNETMVLHHTKHHQAAVDNLNRNIPLCSYDDCGGRTLTQLLQNIDGLSHTPADVARAIRNNAGSHFNHALYWRTLCGYSAKHKYKCKPRGKLNQAVEMSFGSFSNLRTELETMAGRLFGSGWCWLVYDASTKKLKLVNTPNQDNPLMTVTAVGEANRGIPILGVDLWEHAFYLKHRQVRAAYVKLWLDVVDWGQVSANLAHACSGKLERLWK